MRFTVTHKLPANMVRHIQVSEGGCYLWTGCVTRHGYARYRGASAHRAAYVAAVGPIPVDLQLDHLCRIRHCVNPEHLEAVTRQVNQERGQTRAALKFSTHCIAGHLLSGANVRIMRDGNRQCRSCYKRRSAIRQAGLHPTASLCIEPGCDKTVWAKLLCRRHYSQKANRTKRAAVLAARAQSQ